MYWRGASGALEEALSDTPVVLVVGPRQSGKSTFVEGCSLLPSSPASLNENSSATRPYVTLDDPAILEQARERPGEFLDANPPPLTIDEIQRAPELMLPLKLRVDRRRVAGSYLLTGSANVLSLPKVADSLAGRIEVIDLLPLTQAELENIRSLNFIDALFEERMATRGVWEEDNLPSRILRGGFPEPAARASEARRERWFQSYLRTLIERDVRDIANIDGLIQMPRLLTLLASWTGATLNVSSLSRDIGIPNTTLNRYLDLLSALFLLQRVPAWSANLGTRVTKASKVYLVDMSIACSLTKHDERLLVRDRDRFGRVLEGFVANELARLIAYSAVKPWLMHLRTVRQKEVDFVLERSDGRIVGIEVKATRNLNPSDWEGLRFLEELAPGQFHRGIVLYGGTEARPLTSTITALPFSAFWQTGPMLA